MSNIQGNDINKVCRTCLVPAKETMKSIFETSSNSTNISLAEILMSLAPLKCYETDGLSTFICASCAGKLNRFHAFQLKCLHSDRLARKYLVTMTEEQQQIVFEQINVKKKMPIYPEKPTDNDFGLNTDAGRAFSSGKSPEPDDTMLRRYLITQPDDHRFEEVHIKREPIAHQIAVDCSQTGSLKTIYVEPANSNPACVDESDEIHRPEAKHQLQTSLTNTEIEHELSQQVDWIKHEIKTEIDTNDDCFHANQSSTQLHNQSITHSHTQINTLPYTNQSITQLDSITQSGTQSHTQSCNQSITQSYNHPITQSSTLDHSITKSCNQSRTQADMQSNNQLITQSCIQSGSKLITRSCSRSIAQSCNKSIKRLHNQSGSQSIVRACNQVDMLEDVQPCLDTNSNSLTELSIVNANEMIGKCGMGQRDDCLHVNQASEQLDVRPSVESVNKLSVINVNQSIKKGKHACTSCDKLFFNKTHLMIHKHKKHFQEKPYSCNLCKLPFAQIAHLDVHMQKHKGEYPYYCNICTATFNRKVNIIAHLLKHSTQSSCKGCNKKFPIKSTLNTHMRTHVIERPYACKQCYAWFSNETSLRDHKRRHSDDKSYLCAVCDASFRIKYSLKTHIQKFDDMSCVCKVCKRTFVDKKSLLAHKKTHTAQKPYACTKCKQTYRLQSRLKKHMRTHQVARPYWCTVCDRSFRYNKTLWIHMRVHTSENPYSCTVCSLSFWKKGMLKEHMRTHTK